MEYFPRLRKEMRVAENPEHLTTRLALELPKRGVVIQQHYPGLRVVGTAFRPFSMSWGQELRVDLRPVDDGHVEAIIESRFQFPWVDVSHENQKNLDMVEELISAGVPPTSSPAAAARPAAAGA